MSLTLMGLASELRGQVPDLPIAFAKTLVNRAYKSVRERNLWSFQLFEGQWICPPQFTTGTCSVTIGSNVVTLDSTATAALVATLSLQPYSLITQRQFRITAGNVLSGTYNIWGWDEGAQQLTLDRPFAEATSTSSSFTIFQVYYCPQRSAGAAPEYLQDFWSWISVRNIQNGINLDCMEWTRQKLDMVDPQRLAFQMPGRVVPYQRDQNPVSGTFKAFLYELWGTPLTNYTHQLLGIRRGLDLTNNEQLPASISDEVVMAKAKYLAYERAESLRQSAGGPDYKFLMGQAKKEHEDRLKTDRKDDRELVDNWLYLRRNAIPNWSNGYYNTISGFANPGGIR